GGALDGVWVGGDAQRRPQREAGLPSRAVAGALAAARVAFAQASAALPLGPVVVGRPLDLVRGGGDAPEEGYGSSVVWCFTHRASAMKIVSSQMLVARSPTRSRFLEIEMSSMQ